jgi:hypothetical protein
VSPAEFIGLRFSFRENRAGLFVPGTINCGTGVAVVRFHPSEQRPLDGGPGLTGKPGWSSIDSTEEAIFDLTANRDPVI